MKLLLLLSTLILSCTAKHHSTEETGPQGTFSKETISCPSSSEDEGYCDRPQNEEEILKGQTQDGALVFMPAKSSKGDQGGTAGLLSAPGGSPTNEQEPKSSAIHSLSKVSRQCPISHVFASKLKLSVKLVLTCLDT